MSILVVAGWGFGIAILFVALQAWIIRTAGHDALPASAIYAAIFNAQLVQEPLLARASSNNGEYQRSTLAPA